MNDAQKIVEHLKAALKSWGIGGTADVGLRIEDALTLARRLAQQPPIDSLCKLEVDALIDWHHEQKCERANNENYRDADWHKERIQAIRDVLNASLHYAAIPTTQPAAPGAEAPYLDRSDAVNLARNVLEIHDCKGTTDRGVRILCEAVLAMDAAMLAAAPQQGGE